MSEPHFRVVGQIDRGGKKEGGQEKKDGALSCYRAGGGGNRTNINLRVAGSDHNKCQQHDACSLQNLTRCPVRMT